MMTARSTPSSWSSVELRRVARDAEVADRDPVPAGLAGTALELVDAAAELVDRLARVRHPPSPKARTLSITFAPSPPTITGGCGCWSGLGHDQIGSKSTNSPWYSASSSVQIAFIASTRSRMQP